MGTLVTVLVGTVGAIVMLPVFIWLADKIANY